MDRQIKVAIGYYLQVEDFFQPLNQEAELQCLQSVLPGRECGYLVQDEKVFWISSFSIQGQTIL